MSVHSQSMIDLECIFEDILSPGSFNAQIKLFWSGSIFGDKALRLTIFIKLYNCFIYSGFRCRLFLPILSALYGILECARGAGPAEGTRRNLFSNLQ